MFGVGFIELCVIALVVLIVFGPKKLPELMRQLGRIIVYAKRVSNEVKSNIDVVVQETEKDLNREETKSIETKASPSSKIDKTQKDNTL